MDAIVFLGEAAYLRQGEEGGEDGVVGEEDIIKIDFASLLVIDEIPIGIVDGVESESCKIHSNEIEVHALDTTEGEWYLLRLKFS